MFCEDYFHVSINSEGLYLWINDPNYSYFTYIGFPIILIMTPDLESQWYVGALKEKT